jgi:hypothetical protein
VALAYTQALFERATVWLARPLTAGSEGRRSADGLLELATIWAAIHKAPLPECLRQCQYSERHASVAAYVRDFPRLSLTSAMSETTETQSKYQIAPAFAGQQFVHEDLAAPVTAENLTDELAEFFIKKGRSDAFIKRGAVEAEAEPEGKPAADTKASDALKAEKEAHKAEKKAHSETKKELSEVQKQLAEATKQLADIAAKAEADKPGEGEEAK